ncbi:glyoxalase family protein [Hyaloraphidium curvatum]|nr:glyoxalase family protein [Hyaloraphidium curvatum]
MSVAYTTIGTNDLPKALAFWDKVLAPLGVTQGFAYGENGRGMMYMGASGLVCGINTPENGKPHAPGNGWMLALAAPSRKLVDEIYKIAMENGATDEGKPGLRGPEGPQAFYAFYAKDPEGNKFNVCKIGPADA